MSLLFSHVVSVVRRVLRRAEYGQQGVSQTGRRSVHRRRRSKRVSKVGLSNLRQVRTCKHCSLSSSLARCAGVDLLLLLRPHCHFPLSTRTMQQPLDVRHLEKNRFVSWMHHPAHQPEEIRLPIIDDDDAPRPDRTGTFASTITPTVSTRRSRTLPFARSPCATISRRRCSPV